MTTPKKRFLKTPAAKAHFELTATESFQQAIDAAMLQHVENNALPTNDPDTAVASFNRIVGAVQFAKTLMNLGTDKEPDPIKRDGNLIHNLK